MEAAATHRPWRGSALQLGPDGILRALVAAGARMGRGDEEIVLRIQVDGALQQVHIRDSLPVASDRSSARCVVRMNRRLPVSATSPASAGIPRIRRARH